MSQFLLPNDIILIGITQPKGRNLNFMRKELTRDVNHYIIDIGIRSRSSLNFIKILYRLPDILRYNVRNICMNIHIYKGIKSNGSIWVLGEVLNRFYLFLTQMHILIGNDSF